MFLKSLRLENIRCFKHAEIDFDRAGGDNRKWTVLLGENGTGKSTVLRSIALVTAGSDALFELVGDPDDWIGQFGDTARIVAEVETKSEKLRELTLEFIRGEGASPFVSRSMKTVDRLNDALEHTTRNYQVFGYGSSRRLADRGLSGKGRGMRHKRAQAVATLFDRNAELNPLESWAMQLDYRSDGEQLDTVRQVLSDFLPELTFSHIDKEAEALIFKTRDGTVRLDQLSDGYQNVAAWVGDLLYQITEIFEDRARPLEARGLLIIDEVDLHLHPKWQRRLLDFLDDQLPNMQLVVTSHAVMTAQQTPEGALFYSVRRGDAPPEIVAFEGDPGKLLLNQLVMTEAFGHLNDESVDVETAKDRYRALHRKQDKDDDDLKEMKRIAKKIDLVPENDHEQIVMSSRQRRLMQRMIDGTEDLAEDLE